MTSLSLEYSYRYRFASSIHKTPDQASRVQLATCSLDANPYFFDASVLQPSAFAEALLCLGSIVRSHFFERRPGLLDPVVTCGVSRLRFEGFSGCCGVYVQCAFDDSAFSSPIEGRGTTNIDFNDGLIQGLAQTRFARQVQLAVGANEVTLGVDDQQITEKKVKLPLRWLRSFCEVQTYLTDAEHRLTIPAVEALRFVRGLPRDAARKDPLWAAPAGNSLRVTSRPDPNSVPIVGTERLRAIESLLRIVKQPVQVWHSRGVSTWQIELPGCQFMISFSPELYRGFSGEGQVLHSLSGGQWQNSIDQVRSKLKWQGSVEPSTLATQLKVPEPEIRSALDALATRGLLGFDIAEHKYFHRELPFQSDMVESLQPRLIAARKLIAESAVKLHQQVTADVSEWLVRGSGVEHMVRLAEEGDRCTCTWYSKHKNNRGPCKHVLAARMQSSGENY